MIRVTIERVSYRYAEEFASSPWVDYMPDGEHTFQTQTLLMQELAVGVPVPDVELVQAIAMLLNGIRVPPDKPPLEVVSPPKFARELVNMLKAEGLILDLAPPKGD